VRLRVAWIRGRFGLSENAREGGAPRRLCPPYDWRTPDRYMNVRTPMNAVMIAPSRMATTIAQMTITIV